MGERYNNGNSNSYTFHDPWSNSKWDWFENRMSGMGFYGWEMTNGFNGNKIGKNGYFYWWESNPMMPSVSVNEESVLKSLQIARKIGEGLSLTADIKESLEDDNKIEMMTADKIEKVEFIVYAKMHVNVHIGKKLIYGNITDVKRRVDSTNKSTNFYKKYYKNFYNE